MQFKMPFLNTNINSQGEKDNTVSILHFELEVFLLFIIFRCAPLD